MTKFQNKYRTDSMRLHGWDYSSNAAYFVTMCVATRGHYFGSVVNDVMDLNDAGKIVDCFPTLSTAVRWFKGRATHDIRRITDKNFQWQRGYYDRIIRDGAGLFHLRQYIADNPRMWGIEKNNREFELAPLNKCFLKI